MPVTHYTQSKSDVHVKSADCTFWKKKHAAWGEMSTGETTSEFPGVIQTAGACWWWWWWWRCLRDDVRSRATGPVWALDFQGNLRITGFDVVSLCQFLLLSPWIVEAERRQRRIYSPCLAVWNLLKSLLSLHFTISFWKPQFLFAILLSQSTKVCNDQPWYSYQFQGGLKIPQFQTH